MILEKRSISCVQFFPVSESVVYVLYSYKLRPSIRLPFTVIFYTNTFKAFNCIIEMLFFYSEPSCACFWITTNILTMTLSRHDLTYCNLPTPVKSSAKAKHFVLFRFIYFVDFSFRCGKRNISVTHTHLNKFSFSGVLPSGNCIAFPPEKNSLISV